jgi:cysteine desulfurase
VSPIYFDYNATTPLDPGVRAAMAPFLEEIFGNPSSVHRVGRRARVALDDARERLALVLGCKAGELVFTSGGTESNNLAVMGSARRLRDRGRHLIASPTEHHAVLHSLDYLVRREGFELTLLPVDPAGIVDPQDLQRALRPDTILVSVMAANNETGVLQPVAELGAICRERGVLFHTDAVQFFGKEPFQHIDQFQADLISLCAHKFHGPKGAGALYIRSPFQPDPILFGGAHENERRAGTENTALIVGLVDAASKFLRPVVFPRDPLRSWTDRLAQMLGALEGVQLHGISRARLANTLSFSVADSDSIALLATLDLEGICASSGSACSSGALTPSHVLLAMGLDPLLANSFVRFSLGRETTEREVEQVLVTVPELITRVRRVGTGNVNRVVNKG